MELRLMCAVRTAVARAFDAKLVVGLRGRCCNKIRAGNSGTAVGVRAPDVSHGMHAACRTAVSHGPFLPHVPRSRTLRCWSRAHRGPRGAEGGEGDVVRL